MRSFDKLVQKLLSQSLYFTECQSIFKQVKELNLYDFNTPYETIANIGLLGLPLLELSNKKIALETTLIPFREQKFCIVDIETNGSKPSDSQIIEIGAIIYQNGKIVKKFETYIATDNIPKNIVKLTGISLKETRNAPPLKAVLEKFRLFLNDAVFVAHNVNFDYKFISHSMEKAGFGPLLNRKMCTIDLAKKTIEAQKYGLGFLIDFFSIKVIHHRAYGDAYAAMIVFQESLKNIPSTIKTTEELIKFSNPNPKKRKKQVKQ